MNKLFLKKPVNIFTILLSIYSLISLGVNYDIEKLIFLFSLLVFMLLGNFLINKFYIKLSYINTLISMMIFFLILESISIINLVLLTVIFYIIRILRYKNSPVINPVVGGILGLYLLSFLLPLDITYAHWWGGAYLGFISLLFLIPVVCYSIYKFRKHYYFLALFFSFIIIDSLLNGFTWFHITTGTLYFALGIMFLEIKTSPTMKLDQIIIGILGGVLLVFSYKIFTFPILMTILFTNILVFAKKYYMFELKNKN